MRVVALIPGGIGDQILFFPTLDDLKRIYPDAQIDVVVEPRSKGAYRVSKSIHEVLLFDATLLENIQNAKGSKEADCDQSYQVLSFIYQS